MNPKVKGGGRACSLLPAVSAVSSRPHTGAASGAGFQNKTPAGGEHADVSPRHKRFYSERPPPALFRSSSGNFLSVFTERCGAVRSRRKGFSPLTLFVCAAPLRALTAGLTRGAGVGDGSTPWERERQGEKPLFFASFTWWRGVRSTGYPGSWWEFFAG